jgi:hypothetical protein
VHLFNNQTLPPPTWYYAVNINRYQRVLLRSDTQTYLFSAFRTPSLVCYFGARHLTLLLRSWERRGDILDCRTMDLSEVFKLENSGVTDSEDSEDTPCENSLYTKKYSSGSRNETLCEGCGGLDFEALYSQDIRVGEFHPVLILGIFGQTWPVAGCSLCHFFAAVWGKGYERGVPVYLGSISTQDLRKYAGVTKGKETLDLSNFDLSLSELGTDSEGTKGSAAVIAIRGQNHFHRPALAPSNQEEFNHSNWLPSELIYQGPSSISEHWQHAAIRGSIFFDRPRTTLQSVISVKEVPPLLGDFSILRGWIEFCAQNHKDNCCLFQVIPVPQFRLLDCRKRQVVPAAI